MSDVSEDDEDLVVRMMCGDEGGLRLILKRHRIPVTALLTAKYGDSVQHADIEEAISTAAMQMWEKPEQYDRYRTKDATVAGWFYTIAQSRLIDIFRREWRHRRKHPLLDPEIDNPDCQEQDSQPMSKERELRIKDMVHVVKKQLGPKQGGIMQADLVTGDSADAASLAERLDTSKECIYVLRNQAHENIRKKVRERENQRERSRGKT